MDHGKLNVQSINETLWEVSEAADIMDDKYV